MISLVRVLALAALCILPAVAAEPTAIVLAIADGTSQELITAARIYGHGASGRLALEGFPHSAIIRTFSASSIVTDSSASATALARGIKAVNRVVGMASADASSGPPSLLDLAKRAGWSTAVVTDDSVTGATPACFLVEHWDRDENAAIAAKIAGQLGGRADVILGGGSKWFREGGENESYKSGEREIVAQTRAALGKSGATVFDSWEALQEHVAKGGDGSPVLGTFAAKQFSYYLDGGRSLRLKDLAEAAVRLLEARKKPFLLVIEAGLPDKACHANNAARALTEVLEFDATLDWLKGHLGDRALLLATTDHETGGLAINGYPPANLRGEALLRENPVSNQSILTWASGAGHDQQSANTRRKVVQEPGQPTREVVEQKQPVDPDYTQPALLKSSSAFHTGGDIWLIASGLGSDKVHGYMDNTDIYLLIAEAIRR